jgi:p24 family protein alpha
MTRKPSSASGLLLLAVAFFSLPTNALYFYMNGGAPKCFFEELPKDTLVVGSWIYFWRGINWWTAGHYDVAQWNEQSRSFVIDNNVGLFITVDETFDNDRRIVSQKGENKGRFTFTAGEAGEHKLCFSPLNWHQGPGYLASGQEVGGVKITLDLAIGETSNIESTDKGKIQDIVSKVKDLNGRLQDIKREQVFQRVSSPCKLIDKH